MNQEPKWIQKAKEGAVFLNGCWYKPQDYALQFREAKAPPAPPQLARKIGFEYPTKENA